MNYSDKLDYSDFDFTGCKKIEVNDDFIKAIYLEDGYYDNKLIDNSLNLPTGGSALIQFMCGKVILITNSEWGSLNFFNNIK